MTAVRIAHLTDIHWQSAPSLRDFAWKRVLGTFNLYALGRRREFDPEVQRQAVAHVADQRPDVVVVTGDLTAQALAEEFSSALQGLTPLLTSVPTLVLPGNHDVYTPGAQRRDAFQATFGPWSGRGRPGDLGVLHIGPLTVFALDPNRPAVFHSSGLVPHSQLDALARALDDPALEARLVALAVHYPLVDRHGAVYDNAVHGLRNARAVIDVLRAARTRPDLVLCGHIHRSYRASIQLDDGSSIPLVNCGSSGLAWRPERQRAAATGLYTIERGRVTLERWVHDGRAFVREDLSALVG